MIDVLVPKGFEKIAESTLVGTGGVVIVAYQRDGEEKHIYFVVEDPLVTRKIALGPLPLRTLATLEAVLRDVLDNNKVRR